jgi:23S rRNA (cytidine1920-2'-O)/16S rRNA (cytidine1409-2'-O)-methyltransferase
MPKTRLDVLLVERGLAESRARAQALIMAGHVRVEGEVVLKASAGVNPSTHLELEQGPRYVSRGGEKLAAALETFGLEVRGRVCADVGASTGGFTDCLLQAGAAKVYAIDVGKGVLHWKLRNDPRVVVMEQTNARFVQALPEPVSLITIDASFISLKTLLPVARKWLAGFVSLKEDGASPARPEIVVLIKPQFEAGRKQVARGGGVIRDPAIHRQVLEEILDFAQLQGLGARGVVRSPLLGPKGNVEFLAWLEVDAPIADVHGWIEAALSSPAKAPE